jgi:DNA-binding GntR family transcriptional regulator
MATEIRSAPRTKHSLLSDALSSEIRDGRYKVGDRLPSEPELSQRYGVSRHTVRTALRTLHELGLVNSQQGIGTIVQQTKSSSQYSHAFNSAQDLLQYATATKVRIIDRAEVVVDHQMAQIFGCKPGEHWWRLRTVRAEPSGRVVVAYSEIHIPLAFGAVLNESNKSGQPIFALIEKRFGQTITEIQQDITCISAVDEETALHLKVAVGSPVMQITRTYLGANKRVLEVARSLHPNEVFKYSMRVQLQHT